MWKSIFMGLALLALGACAQGAGAVKLGIQTNAEFNEVVLKDVIQARLLAEYTNDDLAIMCWSYLEKFTLANAPADGAVTGEVVGVFSTYQQARNVRRTVVEVNISDEFRRQCGPMLTESMGALGRIGMKIAL